MAKVGGEVDAFCSRCQLLLAHTVIAMVGAVPAKVECNTCRTVHAFRSATGRTARRTSAGARKSGVTATFDQMLAAHTSPPRRYAPSDRFEPGDVVDHPSFGRGFVSAPRDAGKVEITFRTGVKTLVHGKP
jgi:hypothetical protein